LFSFWRFFWCFVGWIFPNTSTSTRRHTNSFYIVFIFKLRNLLIFRLHHSGITMKYHHQLSGLRAPTYMSPP
jgi:hypothetical protein